MNYYFIEYVEFIKQYGHLINTEVTKKDPLLDYISETFRLERMYFTQVPYYTALYLHHYDKLNLHTIWTLHIKDSPLKGYYGLTLRNSFLSAGSTRRNYTSITKGLLETRIKMFT